jgi:hypothetical protein
MLIMTLRSLYSITLCATLCVSLQTVAQNKFLNKVSSLVGAKPCEEVIERSYTFNEFGTVAIHTDNGSITIRSAWNNKKVQLRAVKHAATEEELTFLSVKDTRSDKQLTLTTNYTGESKHPGTIDYVLMVPNNITLRLETKNGMIKVSNNHGPLWATTNTGDIEAESVQGSITAKSKKSGAITLTAIKGIINATTNNGSISIIDAQSAIKAHTKIGNIVINAPRITPHTPIDVTSNNGSITLIVPERNSHIRLHAKTDKGIVTTTCPITLDPVTTAINESSWQSMKKEISGIMGTGTTRVTLNTDHGNIKIKGLKTVA